MYGLTFLSMVPYEIRRVLQLLPFNITLIKGALKSWRATKDIAKSQIILTVQNVQAFYDVIAYAAKKHKEILG